MSWCSGLGQEEEIKVGVMEKQGLGQRARNAVMWNTGFNLFRDLLQFAVMLVLVRILTPEAYGKLALVTSIIGFIAVFSYNQFLSYIIQVRDNNQVHYQEHFTAGAVMACILFVVTNIVAWILRRLEVSSEIAPLLHLMSLSFLNAFPCDFRIKMLEREQDWKRLRLLHSSGLIVSAILGVGMAWTGAGVYALLVPGMVVNLPFTLDLCFWLRWRADWTWSWNNYKAAWTFGMTRIASAFTSNGRQLLESTMLTNALGLSGLGIVNRAMGLAQIFCQKFAFQLMYAIYPALTRLESEIVSVARVNGLVLRIVAWVVIPLGTVFSALATPVVLTVYGERWHDVIPLLPFGMLYGAMAALSETANTLLLSRQRPRLCLIVDIVVLVGTCTMLVWVLPLGAKYYLGSLAMVHGITLGLMTYWLLRIGALSHTAVVAAVVPPTITSALAYFVCDFLRHTRLIEVNQFWAAVAYGVLFSLLYLFCLRLIFSRSLSEIVPHLPGSVILSRLLVLPT